MKKTKLRIVSLVISVITVAVCFSSCAEKSPLDTYDTTAERYNFDLRDYVVVPDYKGVEIPNLDDYTPSQEEIEYSRIRKLVYFAEEESLTEPGTPVEKYDIIVCDYSAVVDGMNFTLLDSSVDNSRRNLIAGTYCFGIPEIDDQLVGLEVGETRTIETTLPEPYYSSILDSGKDISFTISVEKIRRQDLPTYDDEFVSKYYGFSTADSYDTDIESQLKNDYENKTESYESKLVWQYIFDNASFMHVPKKEYTEISNSYMESYNGDAEDAEMSLEQYVVEKEGFTDLSEFYDYIEQASLKAVHEEMVLYYIARSENIQITDEEYNSALTSLGEQYETSGTEACEQVAISKYGSLTSFKEAVRLNKVYNWVGEQATKIDTATYYEKLHNGEYVFDADAAKQEQLGPTWADILIIVLICVGCVLVIVVTVLAVKAVKASNEKNMLIEEKRLEAEEKRARRERRERIKAEKEAAKLAAKEAEREAKLRAKQKAADSEEKSEESAESIPETDSETDSDNKE